MTRSQPAWGQTQAHRKDKHKASRAPVCDRHVLMASPVIWGLSPSPLYRREN